MVTTQDFIDEMQFGAWADEATQDNVYAQTVMHVLSDPTRMEFCVDLGGVRSAEAGVSAALYNWVDPIVNGVQEAKTAKVRIAQGPSIKEKGFTSNVSDPMDSHVDYDNLFTYMIKLLKENIVNAPGSEFTEVSDNQFYGESTMGEEGKEQNCIRTTVTFSQETGDIEMAAHQNGKLARKTLYKLHQSPLIVEGWAEDENGSRISGEGTARQLRRLANTAVDKANSWFG